MPIGKNSIKRVANNGYSSVKTSAPDMENSVIVEEKNTEKKEKKTAPVSKKEAKTVKLAPEVKKEEEKKSAKATEKKTPVKKAVATPKSTVKNTEISEGADYINLGEDMPTYLL